MSDNDQLIKDFVAAWRSLDVDHIMDFFTEDAVYINIPMEPPNESKAAIRAFIEGFAGNCSSIEFVVHHQVAAGNLVMNEGTDKITMGGNTIELPVMGVFEIRDGKISAWRDNVFVERLWRSVKYEEVYLHAYDTVSAAKAGLERYLRYYSGLRPHSSLDRQTPDRLYFEALPLPMAA
ncbi:MAG: nuclear transport factor 2 family protein, partial [Nitrospira sp.]|nr:nuclear transport factor 2 family protein [Nitrospira sp.]